ncbi:3-dehydroquinate synthase [Schleiferia thermophila]|jgi:3-dehydroquinate synthase|uniref:3-dehydroquinate synthase n=1 Tax=Schleiferia thermophila TaxID=884107 RepID=UPI0004E71791|nr:3-dehydroquinate synthase [Schleiferia thermophila]KFD38262.1 3-dehydroquinate synthase [Schleiferia thermophila str. Yellowstone]
MPREKSFFDSEILHAAEGYTYLRKIIDSKQYSEIILLTDSNTQELCARDFFDKLDCSIHISQIEVEPGEECKDIQVVIHLYRELVDLQADRRSLLINLGGGSVSDLGGFVASTYMRGIDYINIPTTLLAMVDAAYGGKTGIDFRGFKNLIGTFYPPRYILLDKEYTATLDQRHFISGFGEVLKYGLSLDASLWNEFKIHFPDNFDHWLDDWIQKCLSLKKHIVSSDPLDNGLRQILNAGHTIGHAIESFHLDNQDELYHGEAIAWGMVAELFIANAKLGFPLDELKNLKNIVQKYFQRPAITQSEIDVLLDYIYMDKKSIGQTIYMPLIKKPGDFVLNVPIEAELIRESLIYMLN